MSQNRFAIVVITAIVIVVSVCAFASFLLPPAFAANVEAQSAKKPEYRIGRIEIRGNKLISAEKIKSVMNLREGQNFDRDLVVSDLQAIENLGYFEPECLTVIPSMRDELVDLVFVVLEAPVLHDVSFRGSTRILDAELHSAFEGLIGLPMAKSALVAAIKKMQTSYTSRGYKFAYVVPIMTRYVPYSSLEGLAGGLENNDFTVVSVPSSFDKRVLKMTLLPTTLLKPVSNSLVLRIVENIDPVVRPSTKSVSTGNFALPNGSKVFRLSSTSVERGTYPGVVPWVPQRKRYGTFSDLP